MHVCKSMQPLAYMQVHFAANMHIQFDVLFLTF